MFRLSTKEDRLTSQKIQFESLLKNGYIQEVYKGLNIFTKEDKKPIMKVYKDTSSKPISFYSYHSLERMNNAKENIIAGYDRMKEYKEKMKANPTASTAANCSKAIKEELKNKFPHIKFSVTCSNCAGGNSVHIQYEDGASIDEVEAITNKYQYGRFDGMTDMYEYTNDRSDLPQAKYVSASREMSKQTRDILTAAGEPLFNAYAYGTHDLNNFIYRIFRNSSIPAGATVTGIESTGVTCGITSPEVFYQLSYSLPQFEAKQEFEKNPVKAGTVQVIEYSEKAIAVIGDTKPIKDILSKLGGRFNFRLSCGSGWIFPKTKLEDVRKAISGKPAEPTLKDEIRETIQFLADTDKKIYGEVTEGTKEAARVQDVQIQQPEHEIYSTMQDIDEAVKGGKVISLLNLCELVNQ